MTHLGWIGLHRMGISLLSYNNKRSPKNIPIINSSTSKENVKVTRLTQKTPQTNVMKKRIKPAIASLASVFTLRAAAAEALALAFVRCLYTM